MSTLIGRVVLFLVIITLVAKENPCQKSRVSMIECFIIQCTMDVKILPIKAIRQDFFARHCPMI